MKWAVVSVRATLLTLMLRKMSILSLCEWTILVYRWTGVTCRRKKLVRVVSSLAILLVMLLAPNRDSLTCLWLRFLTSDLNSPAIARACRKFE